jgi:5'-3' exonuclease
VVGDRVVQIDRRKNEIRNDAAVRAKFGVAPEFIADYLALVGDAADGYPGIKGLGAKTSASLINRLGHIEDFPTEVLSETNREFALLFKTLATLRTDIPLFKKVDALRWQGPTAEFAEMAKRIGEARLPARVEKLRKRIANE